MSVYKAFLLTLLLMVLFTLIQLPILFPFNSLYSTHPSFVPHVFGISNILGFIISYSLMFYIFWKPRKMVFNRLSVNKLNQRVLFLIILMAVGLELFDRVLFDIEKIIDYFYVEDFIMDYPGKYELTTQLMYRTFSALIIAPIFEELFFRKYLLSKLLIKNNTIVSLLFSAFCFSIIHTETPRNLLPTFIFGIISGIIFLKTNRIIYTIFLHFIVNFFWLLLVLIGDDFYQWLYGLDFNLLYWVLPIIGMFFILIPIHTLLKMNFKNI